MKKTFVILGLALAPSLLAQPLKVVTVTAPAVNKVFRSSGVIPVQDFTSPILKTGFLQSRYFNCDPKAPAYPSFIYEYRVDLRNVQSAIAITKLTLDFTSHVKHDYNGDQQLDDVFVITQGGLGNVGLLSAVRNGPDITFTFAGPGVRKGDSSFFFGIASKIAKKETTVTATTVPTSNLTLVGWGPIGLLPGKP